MSGTASPKVTNYLFCWGLENFVWRVQNFIQAGFDVKNNTGTHLIIEKFVQDMHT